MDFFELLKKLAVVLVFFVALVIANRFDRRR